METGYSLFLSFLQETAPELVSKFEQKYAVFLANPNYDYSLCSIKVFWVLELAKCTIDTRHARMCISIDTTIQTWLKLFEKHVLPCVRAYWG